MEKNIHDDEKKNGIYLHNPKKIDNYTTLDEIKKIFDKKLYFYGIKLKKEDTQKFIKHFRE